MLNNFLFVYLQKRTLNIKKPCRSCRTVNGTGHICDVPITETQQTGFGHIFCGFCSEYFPARGPGGNEPALNQCCKRIFFFFCFNFIEYYLGSFCGVVACDKYWHCKNADKEAKLYILSGEKPFLEFVNQTSIDTIYYIRDIDDTGIYK